MLQVGLTPVTDFARLEQRWRALEHAATGGFFRGWTFLGCQAETRFSSPVLLAATQAGEDVALGLFNRAGGRLHLGETGDAIHDAVFAEHGGLLVRPGHETSLAPALRAALRQAPISLPGIDAAQLAACRKAGLVHVQARRFAPAVTLTTLARPYLETLSANTRGQIRRARRLCGEALGLTPAGNAEEAGQFFQAMVKLHQASWRARGQPGAFATETMRSFHLALIERGWPRGEVDVLRIRAAERDIGYLYNFIHGRRVYCYQSGFAAAETAREKPGLVCHSLAIEHYAARGLAIYDLLAGASQYKTSLASGGEMLSWVTLYPSLSLPGLARIAASFLRRG